MKNLATAIAAIALIGTPAFAADMAVKAPAPAPVYNWTGFYGGLNMGVSFGEARTNLSYLALTPVVVNPDCAPELCISASQKVDMNGLLDGVQVGYNWQSGNYLLGIEADFQGTGQSGTRDFAAYFANNTVTGGVAQGTASISMTERITWLGTVRGRVGYVANPWLVYATGGLAYGRIEVDSSASATAVLTPFGDPLLGFEGTPTCNSPIQVSGTCPLWGFSGSGVTKIGWTVGGGAEVALGGNWTAKFEYLFVDLGSFKTTFTGLSGCFGAGGTGVCHLFTPGTGTINSRITDNIVRVGLNYQFH